MVKTIYVDVDGTLTAGKGHVKFSLSKGISYDSEGRPKINIQHNPEVEHEKTFHCRDIEAIKLFHALGIEVIIITGSQTNMEDVEGWGDKCGIKEEDIRFLDTRERLKIFTSMSKYKAETSIMVGDSILDQKAMDTVRGFCPLNAAEIVLAHKNCRTVEAKGGEGVLMDVYYRLTTQGEI